MTSLLPGSVDTSFDLYARLVQRTLGTAMALVSFVHSDRQVFCGAQGLPVDLDAIRQTPLSHSFCQHVVSSEEPLVVADARLDDRVRDNLAIPDLGVIAYAGWPIRDHTGTVVGSLCAIETEPRNWTREDLDALRDLAEACSGELAQRGLREEAVRREQTARQMGQRSRLLLALSEALAQARSARGVARAVEAIAVEHLGCSAAGIWLSTEAGTDQPVRLPGHAAVPGPEVLTLVPVEGGSSERAFLLDQVDPQAARAGSGTDFLVPGTPTFQRLRSGGRDYGVLVMTWPDRHTLGADDKATLDGLASYTAQALQRVLLFENRMDALVTLQGALMPRIPQPDHLDLAARYRPASEHDQVGGDWYDAVVMGSGATALMIGDVVGHDLAAAATMVQLRHMLRTLAWAADKTPSLNVSRLEEAMFELDVDALASLVYARIEQTTEQADVDRHTLRWTNAGHPPPLLVHADGRTEWLGVRDGEREADLFLGVTTDAERRDHTVDVPADSILLLYTDGLVERRGEDLEEGLERLAASAREHRDLSADAFLDRVLDDLLGPVLTDDVAALAVRFNPAH